MTELLDSNALLQPIAEDAPCGPSLEYAPEFLAFEQAVRGKPEAQIGDTITPAAPPDWKEVHRLGLELFALSKDLRIATPLARALLNLHAIAGFAAGLDLIGSLLAAHWDSLHPQLDPDDGNDPLQRINTFESLCDEPLLREIKQAPLLTIPGIGRLCLRDIDISTGELEVAADAHHHSQSDLNAALAELNPTLLRDAVESLQQTVAALDRIEEIVSARVGITQSVNLDAPRKLLERARRFLEERLPRHASAADAAVSAGVDGAMPMRAGDANGSYNPGAIVSRKDVIAALDAICEYYKDCEPSSPVPLLLIRAKRVVSKDFLGIIGELLPESVQQMSVICGETKSDSE